MRGSDEVANKTFAIRSFQKNSRILGMKKRTNYRANP